MELRGEVSADGCLAGPHLAGEHADAAQLDEMAEPVHVLFDVQGMLRGKRTLVVVPDNTAYSWLQSNW